MEKINKPEGLPECKIINTLILKANAKTDYEFNYINELEKIRKLISIEVSRINLLFSEYTPHDEQYHLKRLFFVADQMLGSEVIESMNVTELFLLSVSLYGHDWGMAMSEEEKKYILTGTECSPSQSVNLLDDEKARIKDFCRVRNIELDKIQLEEWKEYVRLTHAFRSGKRIKKYFESISTGVAEFAARICEGHWLDFDVIDDYTSYPTDASIHREVVNVKALTIYVRLIDLLDLGEDRTPFILWKFVAPRNSFSKLEWAKHRALQPVSFPQYQSGRSIQVEGSTDDQSVYMSIMDLKRYVDQQFRQCSDILNRINHSYHKLNISHIDWRIAARGFEPVAIQFEFDRSRMFDILGDEIYQSNPYVFIRELLQNSIDAIAMRAEILEKKDLAFTPKIKLIITEDDICYIVQITDNGIGMDEYIIRNYLAVAGKSYYRSGDFQKEGLKMDPISRFGIGVLSCFMMAEYVEIETFKDPNTTKSQDHLKIRIPSKENYFKISKNQESLNTGTTFRVYVLKKKLPKDKKTQKIINFNITEYLKKTAGFVKYPLSVLERGVETVIVNPNVTTNPNSSSYKIDYRFPIEKAVLPQDKEVTEEFFVEKKIFLRTDLNLCNFDGCITFLLPKSDKIDIVNDGRSWPAREVSIVDYEVAAKKSKKIKWKEEWVSFNRISYTKENTTIPERSFSVYMDGILIQHITPPEIELNNKLASELDGIYGHAMTDTFLTPQLIVNIPKPLGMKIDLARTNIESTEKWDTPIWNAFFEYVKKELLVQILAKDAKAKLLALGKLITFYKLSDKIIIEKLLSPSQFSLPIITSDSKLSFLQFDEHESRTIKLAPDEFSDEFFKLLEAGYIGYKKYKGVLDLWRGSDSLINFNSSGHFDPVPSSLSNLGHLVKSFVKRHCYLDSIEFITSPLGKEFPVVQQVLKTRPSNAPWSIELLRLREISLITMDNYTLTLLNRALKRKFYSFPLLVKFPAPYHDQVFFRFEYVNTNNKVIELFIKICLSVIIAKEERKISDEITGKLIDMINEVHFVRPNYSLPNEIGINDLNNQINDVIKTAIQNGIIDDTDHAVSNMSLNDFVENSFPSIKKEGVLKTNLNLDRYSQGKCEWGKVIS